MNVATSSSWSIAAGSDGFSVKLDSSNSSPYTEIAQSIQETFGQAGIKVEIVPGEQKLQVTLSMVFELQ